MRDPRPIQAQGSTRYNRTRRFSGTKAHLMEWVHIMKHGMRVVRTLCADFGTVELLEQYGDYFKLRVLRQ